MKISYNWLQDYIELSESAEKVAWLLTQSGLEVTDITLFEPVKGSLAGLVIGQVLSCEKHPNANGLKVTQVAVGAKVPLSIVCGAPNVAVEQKVVVAPVGTQLYNQKGEVLKIKKVKIRGEVSEGMLCAEDEIGLGDAHQGIMVLDTPLSPGTPVAQHFHIQVDPVLEMDLTPNRGDACSHLGTARDLGAVLDRPVQLPTVQAFKVSEKHLPLQVTVLDHDACPRYSGVIISGVKVQESPTWLKDRLRAIGIHPTNNVVDAANFVLHELGQPLHTFDYDQIVGKSLKIQQLQSREEIVTLDDQQRKLNGEELVICDQRGPLCIAGILGGKRGSIHADTENIFIESAYFAPGVVRKTAKHHGLKTDASFRYERGTDPHLTVYALKRACLLIQEIAGGTVASEIIDIYPEEIKPCEIEVRYDNMMRLIGVSIPIAVIQAILRRLDIAITQETVEGFVALVPPYRADIRREVDLVEEIVRIYGYDHIEVKDTLGSAYIAGPTHPASYKLQYNITALLANNGYHEIYTNSLTQSSREPLQELYEKQQNVTVLNPLSETLDTLRRTLLFTGLDALAHNLNRKQVDLKLFEFGKTYRKEDQQYLENSRLGIWLTGNFEAPNWLREPRTVTFQDMHAIVYEILHKLNVTALTTIPIADAIYEAGVQITFNQTPLLAAGQVRPALLVPWAIKQPVFFADIDWDQLLQAAKPSQPYHTISKFPPVKRDLSLVLDQAVTFEAVKKIIAQQNEKLIQDTTIFDVYQGDKLPPGKKAYALSFVLQRQDKTLDDKTISRVMARLVRSFEHELGAIIRE